MSTILTQNTALHSKFNLSSKNAFYGKVADLNGCLTRLNAWIILKYKLSIVVMLLNKARMFKGMRMKPSFNRFNLRLM